MVSRLRSGWVAEEQSGVGEKFGLGACGVWDLSEEQLESQLDTGPATGGESSAYSQGAGRAAVRTVK